MSIFFLFSEYYLFGVEFVGTLSTLGVSFISPIEIEFEQFVKTLDRCLKMFYSLMLIFIVDDVRIIVGNF
jgi:hypothetical protein